MKFLPLLILAIFFPCVIIAQSNFKPAYVVKLNGDTVQGYINYREWNVTPKLIEFKANLSDSKATRYEASQIAGFGISKIDRYLSYTGRISADGNVFPDLPSKLDTTTKNDTLFLQISYQGKPLSFLTQRDKQKFRFFVQEGNSEPVELIMHQYYAQNTQLSTANPYIGLLYQLANKYNPTAKNINLNIEKTEFVESDILNVIKIINNDKSKNVSGTTGALFFAGVNVSRTTTQFKGKNDFTGLPSTSYFLRVTGGVDFFTNKYTQKLILRAELSFSSVKASFKSNKTPYHLEYNLEQLSASFSPQVLYCIYNADNFKFYIGAGIELNISAYPKNTYTVYTQPPSVEDDHLSLSNYWTNVPVRAGFILSKKLDINFLYLPPLAYSNHLSYSLSNTVYGLGVNYRFGK